MILFNLIMVQLMINSTTTVPEILHPTLPLEGEKRIFWFKKMPLGSSLWRIHLLSLIQQITCFSLSSLISPMVMVVGIYPFIKILINLELIGQRLSYNHLKITISTNFRTMDSSLRSYKSISLTPSGSASAQTKTKMT